MSKMNARRWMCVAATATAMLIQVEASSATADAATFTGSCKFSGSVVFEPPLSTTPQTITQRVRAPGNCSGVFVDSYGTEHQLSGSPVTFSETSRAENATCAAGTAIGHGTLRFLFGRIRFDFSETRLTGAVVGEATGATGGSARGVATPSPSENPATIAEECAGPGLKKVKIDIELATTPSISG